MEELQSYSKKARGTLTTMREGGSLIAYSGKNNGGVSHSEYVTPLLTENNIIETTASPREFYLIDQTAGYKEPIRTRAEHVLRKGEYLRHHNTPLEKVNRLPAETREQRANREPQWQQLHRSEPSPERLELLTKLHDRAIQLRNEQRGWDSGRKVAIKSSFGGQEMCGLVCIGNLDASRRRTQAAKNHLLMEPQVLEKDAALTTK